MLTSRKTLLEQRIELENQIRGSLKVFGLKVGQDALQYEARVRALIGDDEVCRLFMSIPGVGPLTALVYKSAIDDPKRFAKSANAGVHLGLAPRKYASGEIDYNGRITKCGDPLTRSHLFEAAMVLMRRSAKTSALKAWGTRIVRRGSMKKAYVVVARKLAVFMHRMWLDGTAFDFGVEAAAIAGMN